MNRPGINPTTDDYYGFEAYGLMRTQLLMASGAIPVISEPLRLGDWSNPGGWLWTEDVKNIHSWVNNGGFGLWGIWDRDDVKLIMETGAKISGKLDVLGGFDTMIHQMPIPTFRS